MPNHFLLSCFSKGQIKGNKLGKDIYSTPLQCLKRYTPKRNSNDFHNCNSINCVLLLLGVLDHNYKQCSSHAEEYRFPSSQIHLWYWRPIVPNSMWVHGDSLPHFLRRKRIGVSVYNIGNSLGTCVWYPSKSARKTPTFSICIFTGVIKY